MSRPGRSQIDRRGTPVGRTAPQAAGASERVLALLRRPRTCRLRSTHLAGAWGLLLAVALVAYAPCHPLTAADHDPVCSFDLKHARAEQLAPALRQLLVGGAPAEVLIDAEHNRILVRGAPAEQQLAGALIARWDRPEELEVSAAATTNTPHRPTPSLGAPARVAAAHGTTAHGTAAHNTAAHNTAAHGTPAHNTAAHNLAAHGAPSLARTPAASLGTSAPPSGRHAAARPISPPAGAVVRLEETESDAIESIVRAMLAPRLATQRRGPAGLPGYILEEPDGRLVELGIDRAANQVRIEGTHQMVGEMSRLLRVLDSPPQPAGRIVRVLPLGGAPQDKVEAAIRACRGQWSAAGAASLGGAASWGDVRPTAHVAPIGGAGGFHSYAADGSRPDRPHGGGSDHHLHGGGSARLARTLFQPAGNAAGGAQQPPSPVDQSDPGDFEADDREAEAQRERVRALGTDVEVEMLPELDVLILRGGQKDVDDLIRIIREIEQISAENEPEIEVVPLAHAPSAAVAAVIAQIRTELLAGRQGRASATPLAKPNALLLIGWGEALDAMRDLVAKLDQPVAPEAQLRVFRLKHATATTAQTTVVQFFANRGGLGPQVQATADARSNSLIVHASNRDMAEVELLIQRLDTPQSDAVNQMQIFRLRNTLAADVGPVLQAAISGAAGETGPAGQRRAAMLEFFTLDAEGRQLLRSGILENVLITPDPRTNTLLVSAPPETMDLLAALVEALDSLPATAAQVKVFRIVNGEATALVDMLRNLLGVQTAAVGPQLAGAEGESSLAPLRFAVDARTNSIIASGSTGDLTIIEAILLRLDESEAQNRRNHVYRLRNAPAIDVAVSVNEFLRSERVVQLAAPGLRTPFQQIESEVVVVPEPVSNSLIVSATPRFFEEIQRIILELDQQPPQVVIQVLIAEVTLTNTDEFGVELGLQDSILFDRSLLGDLVTVDTTTLTPGGTVASQEIVGATNTPGFNFNNQPLGNSGSNRSLSTSSRVGSQALSSFSVGRINNELGYGGLVLSASSESVSVLIRALRECRRLDVLSRPQIMTLDNQPAFIQVGQRVPRITGTQIVEGVIFNSVELENVGLILGVRPRISPEGLVVMEIDAERSDVDRSSPGVPVSISPSNDAVYSPIFNTTTAQTTISAASGQTIVLGGLITKSVSRINRRVPLLSSIPILGNLFRYDFDNVERRELLIVLTPRVVRNEAEADEIKHAEAARMSWCLRDVRRMHGDLGIYDAQDPEMLGIETRVIYPHLEPHAVVDPLAPIEQGPELAPPGAMFPASPHAPRPWPPGPAPDEAVPPGPVVAPPPPVVPQGAVPQGAMYFPSAPPAGPAARGPQGGSPRPVAPVVEPVRYDLPYGHPTVHAGAAWPQPAGVP